MKSAAIGFIPVAIHFNFFLLLNRIGPVATAQELTNASDAERSDGEKQSSPLCKMICFATDQELTSSPGLRLTGLSPFWNREVF